MRRAILIILFLLLCSISSKAFADCMGCYDFVKVEIKLNDGENLIGYVYESVDENNFELGKIEKLFDNYKYNFIYDYIDLNIQQIDINLSSTFEYDIFINTDATRHIKPSNISTINEISRTTKGLYELNMNDYKMIKNEIPTVVSSVGIDFGNGIEGPMVYAIAYDNKYNNKTIQEIFRKLSIKNKCTIYKEDTYDENIESDDIAFLLCDIKNGDIVDDIKKTDEELKKVIFLIKDPED